MERVIKYFIVPLQQKIFKNFGYYDISSSTFKVNASRVNDILAGNIDPFGRRITEADKKRKRRSTSGDGASRGHFRLIRAEVKSAGLLDFVVLLTRKMLLSEEERVISVERIEIVLEFVPDRWSDDNENGDDDNNNIDRESQHETSQIAASCCCDDVECDGDNGGGKYGASSTCRSCGSSALHSARSESKQSQQREGDSYTKSILQELQREGREEEDTTDAHTLDGPTPEALFDSFNMRGGAGAASPRPASPHGRPAADATPSDGADDNNNNSDRLDTVGDLMRFIRRQLQGIGASVDQISISLIVPSSASASPGVVDGAVSEGSTVFNVKVMGGVRAKVDRTSDRSEDVDASVHMGDWRLFMHTVTADEPLEMRQQYATRSDIDFKLHDLFAASQPARTETNHKTHQHQHQPHEIRVSYTSASAPPSHASDLTLATTAVLFTTIRASDWTVVCRPEQLSILTQTVDSMTSGLSPAAAQAPATPPPVTTTPSSSDGGTHADGAPVNSVDTVKAALAAADNLHQARKLFHVHFPSASLTLLTQRGENASSVADAWRLALPSPTNHLHNNDRGGLDCPPPDGTPPVYDVLRAAHITVVCTGTDVLFPEIEPRLAFRPCPEDPRQDAATKKKRSIIRNLFRNGIADPKLTTLMETYGGTSTFSAVQSIHVLEYRGRSHEALCTPTPILQAHRLPYALVHFTRRSALVPVQVQAADNHLGVHSTRRSSSTHSESAAHSEVYEETVVVALGKVQLLLDPEFLDVMGAYAATLMELLHERHQLVAPPAAAAATNYDNNNKKKDASSSCAPCMRRMTKVLVERVEATIRYPVLDEGGHCEGMPGGTSEEPSLMDSIRRHPLLRRLLHHLSAKSHRSFRGSSNDNNNNNTNTSAEGTTTTESFLSFPTDAKARFLPVVVSLHLTDFQAERTVDGVLSFKWKEAVGALVDVAENPHLTTEVLRVDYSDDMDISVYRKDLVQEQRIAVGGGVQPDTDTFPSVLREVFSVCVHLGEVVTQPLTQDDYILTVYYIRSLLASAKACRRHIARHQPHHHSHLPAAVRQPYHNHKSTTAPSSPDAATTTSMRQHVSAAMLCDLVEGSDILAEVLASTHKTADPQPPLNREGATGGAGLRDCDMADIWRSPNANTTYVEFQIRRVLLCVRAPRLSPEGTPLGESLARCLPREVYRAADPRLLYHNYILSVSRLSVAYFSCDTARVGAAVDIVARVSGFSLAEDIAPWPGHDQHALVHEVCLARSYTPEGGSGRPSSLAGAGSAADGNGGDGGAASSAAAAGGEATSSRYHRCAYHMMHSGGGAAVDDEPGGKGDEQPHDFVLHPFPDDAVSNNDVFRLHLTSRKLFGDPPPQADGKIPDKNPQRVSVSIMLHRVGFHHLQAHLGDSWPATLSSYFTDRLNRNPGNSSTEAVPSPEATAAAGAMPAPSSDHADHGDDGDHNYAHDGNILQFDIHTTIKVDVTDVMWAYRPQGAGRSLLAALAPDMMLAADVPSFDTNPVISCWGSAVRPASLYLCNDCDIAALQENVLNKTGAGWGADLESAGFVRVVDIRSSFAKKNTKKNGGGGVNAAEYANINAAVDRSPHADKPATLRIHHLQVNTFVAKDSLAALRECVDSLYRQESLQYMEPPHRAVMRCGRGFQWVAEAVARESAPMTYRLNPSLASRGTAAAADHHHHQGGVVIPSHPSVTAMSSLFSGSFREGMRWSDRDYVRQYNAYQSRVSTLMQQSWRSSSSNQHQRSNSNSHHRAPPHTTGDGESPLPQQQSSPGTLRNDNNVLRRAAESSSSFDSVESPRLNHVVWNVLQPTHTARNHKRHRRRGHHHHETHHHHNDNVIHLPTAFAQEAHYLSGMHRPVPVPSPVDIHRIPLQMEGGDEPPRVLPPTSVELFLTHCGLNVCVYDGHDLTDAALRQQRRGYNQITGVARYRSAATAATAATSSSNTPPATAAAATIATPAASAGDASKKNTATAARPTSSSSRTTPLDEEGTCFWADETSSAFLEQLHREGTRRGFGDRSADKRLVLCVSGISLQLNTFSEGAEEQKWVHLIIDSGVIYDCIGSSDVRKLLMATPAHPGDWVRAPSFFEMTWMTILPVHASYIPESTRAGGGTVGLRGNPEEIVALRLQPVSLTLSGASLDFLLRLFTPPADGNGNSKASPGSPKTATRAPPRGGAARDEDVLLDDGDDDVLLDFYHQQQQQQQHPNHRKRGGGAASAAASAQPPPLFFRRFTLYPTTITLSGSFESNTGLLSAIAHGNGIDVLRNTPLLSWLSVRDLPLVIPLIRTERCGMELLQERIVEDSRCKSIRFLLTACCCVVHPLSAAARVGDAARGLVLVPFTHGRGPVMQHVITKASTIFLSEVVSQSAHVGSMLTNGTYRASRVLLEAVMGHPMHAIEGPSRARQPATFGDGLRDGQEQLNSSLRDAFDYCLGPDGNLMKVPAAGLRILMGLTGLSTSALWGIRNSSDPDDARGREEHIYKHRH